MEALVRNDGLMSSNYQIPASNSGKVLLQRKWAKHSTTGLDKERARTSTTWLEKNKTHNKALYKTRFTTKNSAQIHTEERRAQKKASPLKTVSPCSPEDRKFCCKRWKGPSLVEQSMSMLHCLLEPVDSPTCDFPLTKFPAVQTV